MLRLGTTGLFICGWQERPRVSRIDAVALLGRCLSDPSTVYALRALLGQLSSAEKLSALDDRQLVEELAAMIERGELLLFGDLIPRFSAGGATGRSTAAAQGPPPPRKASQSASAPVQTDPSLFPANTDLAAMAAAMNGAARTGAPFCEH